MASLFTNDNIDIPTIKFTTDCRHHGTVQTVRVKNGGPKEGKWICTIRGPKVTPTGRRLVSKKKVYCEPNLPAAKYAIAKYLGIQASKVKMSGDSISESSTSTSPPNDMVPDMIPSPAIKSEHPSTPCSKAALIAKATPNGQDIWEASPNSMARCRICNEKVLMGQQRIGKWTYQETYNNWIYLYYHEKCASDELKASLQLKDTVMDDQTREELLASRKDLSEMLRQLRLEFSRVLNVEPYKIFHNATLDDITVKMPLTKSQLVACYGIKERKYKSFGTSILRVTNHYSSMQGQRRRSNCPGDRDAIGRRSNGLVPKALNFTNDDDSDDDLEVVGTISCEDIVRQKVEHAAAHGYIIEL